MLERVKLLDYLDEGRYSSVASVWMYQCVQGLRAGAAHLSRNIVCVQAHADFSQFGRPNQEMIPNPIKTAGHGKCAEAADHHHCMITASLVFPRVGPPGRRIRPGENQWLIVS